MTLDLALNKRVPITCYKLLLITKVHKCFGLKSELIFRGLFLTLQDRVLTHLLPF